MQCKCGSIRITDDIISLLPLDGAPKVPEILNPKLEILNPMVDRGSKFCRIHTLVSGLIQNHNNLPFYNQQQPCYTSNVTGSHRGLKRKLVTEHRHYNACHLPSAFTTTHVIFSIVKWGITHFLCAMRVFEVRTSSSSPRLPLCQISFLSRPPLLS